jgi:nucleotide-binding universal stress UspA family protein
MTYTSVLVPVLPDETMQYRLRAARAVAERFDAMLIGIAVENIRPAPFDDGYTGIDADWFATMRDVALKKQQTAHAQFDLAATGLRKGDRWISGFADPASAVAKASSAADLIVTSRPPYGRRDAFMDAEPAELALTSGRPVLVVPPGAPPLVAKRILLAWKDTREARRAMTDALPFLKQAEAVLVLESCEADGSAEAETRTAEVVSALGRHGVSASGKMTDGRMGACAEIGLEAEIFGADLVVAGAYGHSRLGEWAFGGVTRDLLRQDQRHVLLSH